MVLNIYINISIDVGNNYFYTERSSEKENNFSKKIIHKKKWYVKNKNRIQLAKMMMMWERETRNSSKKEVSEKGKCFLCLKKTWFRYICERGLQK